MTCVIFGQTVDCNVIEIVHSGVLLNDFLSIVEKKLLEIIHYLNR
jgi:hypothetical protein